MPLPEQDGEFLDQMRKRMDESMDYWQETFDIGKSDVERIYIQFWDPVIRAERDRRQRATVTVNVMPQNIQKLIAALRKSKVDIRYNTTGGIDELARGMPSTLPQRDYAALLEGIARHISYQSNAPFKYAAAASHAAESGLGFLMLRLGQAVDDPFNRDIFIDHLTDRWAVSIDPFAIEPDFSDMDYAFVRTLMSIEEFNKKYPDIDAMASLGAIARNQFPEEYGRQSMGIEVFDYYRRVPVMSQFTSLIHMDGRRIVQETAELEPYLDELMQQGFVMADQGRFETKRVMKTTCTATMKLEEDQLWPGKHIPIIPVLGRRVDTESKSLFFGLVHYALDIQQNMCIWLSNATEKAAKSSVNPYIVRDDQIEAYRDDWENMGINRPEILMYSTDDPGEPPPRREPQAPLPIAELQMMQQFMSLMPHATGLHEAMLGQPSNETSGRAIERRQQSGDDQLYDFIDNLVLAVRCVGIQLKDIIPKVYRGSRLAAVRYLDDQAGQIPIDYGGVITDEQGQGRRKLMNVLALGRYDCRVDVGPALISQRREMSQFLMKMIEADPAIMGLYGDMFFKGMDVPYSDEMVRRFRMVALDPSLLSEEERQQRPPPPPDPAAEAEKAITEMKLQQAQVGLQGEQSAQHWRLQTEKLRHSMAELKLETEEQRAGMEVTRAMQENAERAAQPEEDDEPRIQAIVRDTLAEERRRSAS